MSEKGTILDNKLFDLICKSSDNTFFYVCDMKSGVSRWSKMAVDYFGLPGEYMKDVANIWVEYIHPDDRHLFLRDIESTFKGEKDLHVCEYRAKNNMGEYVWLKCRGAISYDDNGNQEMFAGIMYNMGMTNKFDPITKLKTIFEFINDLDELLLNHTQGAILLMGIDNFKDVNNIYKYSFGNKVLSYISNILLNLDLRGEIYRMDGDKIALILPGYNDQEGVNSFHRIKRRLNSISSIDNCKVQIDISGGVVEFNRDGKTSDVLHRNLEYSLDMAKQLNRGNVFCFSETLHEKFQDYSRFKEALRASIKDDFKGFEVFYQPIVQPKKNKIVAFEALLRWKTPEFMDKTPDDFIPILEETGLINAVGAWVINQTLIDYKRLSKYYDLEFISVNVSYIQFKNTQFRKIVADALVRHQIPANRLVLELTESCKIIELSRLKAEIDYFRELGIQTALDDFGTGYASVNVLRDVAVDWVKLDHTFVSKIEANKFDKAIIEYMITLCRRLSIDVIVEGIENKEIAGMICDFNPRILQGFYFSRPVSIEQLIEK